MSHGLADVMLQSTQHDVILHGLLEVMSECQVILHDSFLTSLVLMAQNGRKCITYINLGIKHVFLCITICVTPRAVLKPEPERRGF